MGDLTRGFLRICVRACVGDVPSGGLVRGFPLPYTQPDSAEAHGLAEGSMPTNTHKHPQALPSLGI